jgi:hypothetical protein
MRWPCISSPLTNPSVWDNSVVHVRDFVDRFPFPNEGLSQFGDAIAVGTSQWQVPMSVEAGKHYSIKMRIFRCWKGIVPFFLFLRIVRMPPHYLQRGRQPQRGFPLIPPYPVPSFPQFLKRSSSVAPGGVPRLQGQRHYRISWSVRPP